MIVPDKEPPGERSPRREMIAQHTMQRNHPTSPRTNGQRLLVSIILVALTLTTHAADFLVESGAPSPAAGGKLTLQLVALNPTDATATREFPATIDATLSVGSDSETVKFQTSSETKVSIAPNGFARITYQADIPGRISGAATLKVTVAGSPTFHFDISPAPESIAPEPAKAGHRFSVTEAMDQQPAETSFFKRHIFPYEPFYFLAGPDAPSVKFQVSIKYRLVNTEIGEDGEGEGWLYRHARWMDGLHLAYTQRSLWDIQAASAPFLDSSYMPELLYERPNLIDPEHGWLERIGAQIGVKHESNGKDGADSRSLNIGYVRVPFVFGDENNFYVSLEPRAWFYFEDMSDNPDLPDYRGYIDLKLKAGWARGLQVAGWLRAGKDFDRGSAQVDVTYPLHNLLSRSFSLYLQAQYFNGYGESLLYYNQRSEIWRVGIGLYR